MLESIALYSTGSTGVVLCATCIRHVSATYQHATNRVSMLPTSRYIMEPSTSRVRLPLPYAMACDLYHITQYNALARPLVKIHASSSDLPDQTR
jgi:hypothetical protein